jgi:predicted DNA-binding protein (MmcQ/YjbR family)
MALSIDAVRDYCLSKEGTITEELPFGEGVLVYKVEGKMFLLTMLDRRPLSINLKADPEYAIELRERYESVKPGYHQNKKYWNTVVLDDTIPSHVVLTMIDHSYEQVVSGLPKKKRTIVR